MAQGQLTAPEGILMLCVAGLLDIIGLILLCLSWLGVDDYGILDIIGFFIIGGWLLIRTGTMRGTKGAQQIAKKVAKKFGIAFIIELIPFVGSAAPSWTWCVYSVLKDKE